MNSDKKTSKGLLISVIVVAALWVLANFLLSLFCIPNNTVFGKMLNMFVDLPGMISDLFIPLIIVMLPYIYQNIAEEKWYSEKVDINLSDKDKIPLERYELDMINDLMKNETQKEFVFQNARNKYFDYVFQLQETDADFNLIWNNFNYYDKKKSKRSHFNYWKIIVYRRIVEYVNKEKMR